MNSIGTLLAMIATEAAEPYLLESAASAKSDMPKLDYPLELLEMPDSSLQWVE